jgi:uncharacterized protein (UPF0548 family)
MGLLRTADLDALAEAPLTYPDRGGTRSGTFPTGYDHLEQSGAVGTGPAAFERAAAAAFERAAAAVLDWGAQRGVGFRVRATGPASEQGAVAVLTAGLPDLGFDFPCRVVWAQTTGDERGFGYGTLPGHPESGEESFVVSLRPDGEVVFTVRAFSRPAALVARLGGPLTRVAQRLAAEAYIVAIRRAVNR